MLLNLVVSTMAVIITAYILPGIKVDGLLTAFIVAIVLGAVNMFIRPVLLFLTFPLTILTLGLFTFIVNAFLVLLVGALVPGFEVSNFWWALIFSLVLSIISSFLSSLAK